PKVRHVGSCSLVGPAILSLETVALFPAILALALLVGFGTSFEWKIRLRWSNLARSVAFAELAFAPLLLWRHIVGTHLPHNMIQEPFVGGEHHVAGVGGAARP